jgi:3-oxoadipate enol-lactonase
VVSKWFTPGFAARRPDVIAAAEAMLAGIDDEGYAACCGVLAELDLRADLPRITAPTLVVSGAEDQATPPAHQRAIADAVPGAEYAVLDDAAHIAAIEQPLAVTGAVLGHLDAAGDAR